MGRKQQAKRIANGTTRADIAARGQETLKGIKATFKHLEELEKQRAVFHEFRERFMQDMEFELLGIPVSTVSDQDSRKEQERPKHE